MAVLTYLARTAWAKYLLSRPLFLAIGNGEASWDTTPKEVDYEATALTHEIGRKKITRSYFVNEDDDGEIDMPGGRRYSYSETPTRHIYLSCMFNYGEGVAEPIREVGVFIDTQVKSGLPATQSYFVPGEIQTPGTLILLEHLETADIFTPKRKGYYGTILTI
ncbi:MAG: hypothetical protein IJT02_08330 [Synergistaceae bacterium]|nr:hypothetical protein [Synergistaceae bacterium]